MSKKIGTLIKTFKGSRYTDTGQMYHNITIFYRDENGEKRTMFFDRPDFTYYVLKDTNSEYAKHPPLYMPLDKVRAVTTPSDMLFKSIARETGTIGFYDRIRFNYGVKNRNMNNLFRSPLLYNADIDLEDYYISKFYEEFDVNKNYKLHKCYFDIENDIYHYSGFPSPDEAPCPTSLITLFDEKEMKFFTFILRNKNIKELVNLESDLDNFYDHLHNTILNADNVDCSFEFKFYDDESVMIKEFFNKVHEINPDYCGAWNMSYDLKTMCNRLINLHGNRKNTNEARTAMQYSVCDEKYAIQKNSSGKDIFINPRAYYSQGFGKYGTRTDTFNVLDGINWVDQMLTYAVLHISQGKEDSYKLDNIANKLLHKEKLPFENGETIRNQLYKNPRRFIEYNIRDVLLLYLIEQQTKDIDNMQKLADITLTRNSHVFKKSISLINFINSYAKTKNLVMGTNKNKSYGNETEYYDKTCGFSEAIKEYNERYLVLFERKDKYGAFVSNPLNNDHVGLEILNKISKFFFDFVCDEDFKALYPSILAAFNLDSTHIDGKFYLIDERIKNILKSKYHADDMFLLSKKDDESNEDEYDEEDEVEYDDDGQRIIEEKVKGETDDVGRFISEMLVSADYDVIGNICFGLPSSSDVLQIIDKKIKERSK